MAFVIDIPASPQVLDFQVAPEEYTTEGLARLAIGVHLQAIEDTRGQHTKAELIANFRQHLELQLLRMDHLDSAIACAAVL